MDIGGRFCLRAAPDLVLPIVEELEVLPAFELKCIDERADRAVARPRDDHAFAAEANLGLDFNLA